MPDPNLPFLEAAVARLGSLTDRVVFVGGATIGLLINDPGAAPIRATMDIDVIAEITSPMDYYDFSDELRPRGFIEDDRPGAPACRWLHGHLVLDVMPLDSSVLGFTNRWYLGAHKSPALANLRGGRVIRVIAAPYFLCTKIEAFRNRGNQDYSSSRDLEDFISVLDGRPGILREIEESPAELQRFLAESAHQLLNNALFSDVLPGFFLPDSASQQRLPMVRATLLAIAAL